MSATLSRSGDIPSAVATHGDASSGFVRVVFFVFCVVFARGNVGVTPALATGPLGTTAARSGERGAKLSYRRGTVVLRARAAHATSFGAW